MLDVFVQSPLYAEGSVFVLSLCIGSFLNVVVYRLPIILENEWKAEAREILELPEVETPRFNLSVPRSRCPHCGHQITAIENIPLISWLALRGRCSECRNPISPRYPLVELSTALLSLLVVMVLGPTPQTLVALPFTWALISLALIDIDTVLLPDNITQPLIWAGLLVNMQGLFVPLPAAVIGAVAGYLSLWSINWLFSKIAGREGIGQGDFKLLAAFGAWMGWQLLPMIVLLSAASGAVAGLVYMAVRRKNLEYPWGPYLAAAGFIALLWGKPLMQWYLSLSHV